MSSLEQQLAQKRDTLEHTELKSPVRGIVKNLKVTTRGAEEIVDDGDTETQITLLRGFVDNSGKYDFRSPLVSTVSKDRVGVGKTLWPNLDQSTHVADVNGDGRLDYVFVHDGKPQNNGADRTKEKDGTLIAYLADEHGQFHDNDVIELKLPKDAVGTKVGGGTGDYSYENYGALIDKHFAFKTQEGTAGGERLDGTDGADRIVGKGGADEIRALGGDDMIFVPDLDFESIDGGDGVDRLLVTGEKELSKLGDKDIADIEVLDLRGSGKNTLTLTDDDVKKLSKNIDTEALRIEGDQDDTVNFAGFTNTSLEKQELSAGVDFTYDVYTQGSAKVWVDTDISVVV